MGAATVNASDLQGLRYAWRNRQLVLFIGAGVSIPYGLPSWKSLVLELLFEQAQGTRRLGSMWPHYRRAVASWMTDYFDYDPLVQVMARAVCAAYWFHPLMWTCWRQLRLEAERACDDAVLTRFEATDYASQLVRIARGVTSDLASRVLPATTHHGELATRVAAILDAGQCRSTPRVGRAVPAILFGIAAAAWIACIAPTTAYAVRASPPPAASFAAALVRESTGAELMTLVRLPDGSVRITAATVQALLRLAYGVQAHAIVDTPALTATTRYDIHASPARPASPEATLSMLRALLAERFGLRVAHESRVQRVIVIGLPTRAEGLPPATPCASTPTPAPNRLPGARPPCGFDVRPGQIQATAVDVDALAATLSTAFGTRVLVEPARSGPLRLQWTPTGGDALPLMESLRTQVGAAVSEQERRVPVLAIKAVHQPT